MGVDVHPNEDYAVVGGRITTRSLEVHVVNNCNLRCALCCSLSPLSAPSAVAVDAMAADLELARRALAPKRLKLVGGEPLLHPDLIGLLRVARDSGIAPSVSVTTNGFLLLRADEKLWELVDHLTVSLYPSPPLRAHQIARIKDKATAHGVAVNWKRQDRFVQMDRDEPDADGRETAVSYRDCWLRRRCHLLADGRFYTCTRPIHFDAVHGGPSPYLDDGIVLADSEDLVSDLYRYLVQPHPLTSCAVCLGGDGAEAPHRQLSAGEARAETIRRQAVLRQL